MKHTHANSHSHPHIEEHKESSEVVKDFVLGMADGLTVPFALAAGLSGAVDASNIIVAAGGAEIAAGAIAMGLGGYLAAKTAAEHYNSELAREHEEIINLPHVEEKEVAEILQGFGVPEDKISTVVDGIKSNPDKWVDFMMKFELGLEKPDAKRLYQSPITIGFAYILGGMIPLFPYIVYEKVSDALQTSIIVTIIALAAFGWFKGKFTGTSPLKSSLQTTIIGSLAAATAYFVAKLIA
jgi:VIT1/CCC1 family predicted Fe2+/Mn2+ transporter